MSKINLRVTTLNATHNRTAFKCDSVPLDRYFQQQVTQDIKRKIAACFVALTHDERIAGYYKLAAASILLSDLPPSIGKKLPRYPTVPAVRMGRLAVDLNYKGIGLGGALLADALARTTNSEIAAYAMLVDAKDKKAANFYKHHGFIPLPNSALTLFLPLATVTTVFNK